MSFWSIIVSCFIMTAIAGIIVTIMEVEDLINRPTEPDPEIEMSESIASNKVSPNLIRYDKGGYSYLVDNNTGVVYLQYQEGISVMFNPDGTPITRDQLGLEYWKDNQSQS